MTFLYGGMFLAAPCRSRVLMKHRTALHYACRLSVR